MAATPQGMNTIIPYLNVKDAAQAIEMYKKAFGAKEVHKMMMPGSDKVMHACLEIGTSRFFISESMQMAPTVSSFYLYRDNADQAFTQAKQAGMQEMSAPADMFWGDRMGTLKDRFGITWSVATHMRDVSPEEMQEGAKKMMNKQQAA
jgi:PhnB protein